VQALGCDFYAFTGHKVYGPTGIGVLYGRFDLLSAMPPYQGGGEMILHVSFEKTEYQEPPHRFEAGTPNIAGAIGLGIALDFIEELGRENILDHEEVLTGCGVDRLSQIPGLRLLGAGQRRLGILSFDLDGVHPHDVAQVLDQQHVAVRAGHHCAQPLMERLGLSGTTRASLGVYNDETDIERLATAIEAARELFAR
jgi:cysteine desulfurase/selenocysteine lyase